MLDNFLSWISSMWGTAKYIGGILILIVIYGAIRNWMENFLYYMQDYTTGFFKVRDKLAASTGASIEELGHLPFDEQYINYGLDIGSVEGNIYQDKMRIPGTLRSTHIYMVGASGAGKSSLLRFAEQELKGSRCVLKVDFQDFPLQDHIGNPSSLLIWFAKTCQ
ncbi:hypothetical protein KKB99_05665, partial [bacterium]|nr:hypothetical protein [bacterium]MBU1025479.1 hypothetical protein [bacterium]